MNTNSNTYTIIYSAVMVVVVAATLAFAASALKEPQQKNIEIEKKMNILMSVGKAGGVSQANDKNAYIDQEYNKYIVDEYVVNVNGEKVEGEAFDVDLKGELKKSNADERLLPVFVYNDNGNQLYIFPVTGAGLWGALWGYVSLENDFNTIYGATFDHAGETPGLGAEIATPPFQNKFKGKKLYENGRFVSVKVLKAGSPVDDYSVDGISGGTITSVAVGTMIANSLINYQAFFEKHKKGGNNDIIIIDEVVVPDVENSTDSTANESPVIQ